MAPRATDIVEATGDHLAHFYETSRDLRTGVARHLRDALITGGQAFVIATPAHRAAFAADLGLDGPPDVSPHPAPAGAGAVTWLDAAAVASAIRLEGGGLDPSAFQTEIAEPIRRAAAGGPALAAFGEVVALLWEAGDVLAVIDLERGWDALIRDVGFSLYCAYPSGLVSGDGHREPRRQVCDLHSAVLQPAELAADASSPSTAPPMEARWSFPGTLHDPRVARHRTAATLQAWGLAHLIDDAALVVSELTANAVVHAGSPFTVTVTVQAGADAVRIAVHDHSGSTPTRRRRPVTAEAGRGLGLVATLAARWGGDLLDDGKVVWAELAR